MNNLSLSCFRTGQCSLQLLKFSLSPDKAGQATARSNM
jgi:hypothetical protein